MQKRIKNKYKLREDVEVNFGHVKKYYVADRIGINKVTLSNILNRKVLTSKPIAFYITFLNGGKEENIEDFFERIG